jgi:ATP-dependent DNA helicase RecG
MKIQKLIEKGESSTIEFKQSFGREVIETAVAFANTKGGKIFIGITDNGEIVGTSIGKETLKDWSNQISQISEPSIHPEIELVEIDNKTIVQILFKEYPLKPISVRGRCFRRVKNSNYQMAPSEITEMHLQSTGNSWDALPARDNTIQELDPEIIEDFIKRSSDTGRRKFNIRDSRIEILVKLELIKNNHPCWASVLLFGKNPQSPLTQATVHCGRFKGKTTIIDDRLISGSIIHQVDEVMDFIRKNINVKFRITGKPQRKEIWDYPLNALREAVTNAICHRDYSELSDIQVKIYDSFIQIWNPGGLPFGLTIDDLYDPLHTSKPRNKLIAQIFYDTGFIERYGSGIQRMIEECMKMNIPEPEFAEKFGGFTITFRKDMFTHEYLSTLKLNERQIEAVIFVKKTGKITNTTYQRIGNVKKRTATNEISKLVELNILERIGTTGKGTLYVLRKGKNIKGAKGATKGQ